MLFMFSTMINLNKNLSKSGCKVSRGDYFSNTKKYYFVKISVSKTKCENSTLWVNLKEISRLNIIFYYSSSKQQDNYPPQHTQHYLVVTKVSSRNKKKQEKTQNGK